MDVQINHGIGRPQAGVATIFGTAKAPVPAIAALPFATPAAGGSLPQNKNDVPAQFMEDLSPHYRAFFQLAPFQHSWMRGGLND
jgi:hypothetical protein